MLLNTNTSVGHINGNHAFVTGTSRFYYVNVNYNMAAIVSEFHGIIDKISNDLPNSSSIRDESIVCLGGVIYDYFELFFLRFYRE